MMCGQIHYKANFLKKKKAFCIFCFTFRNVFSFKLLKTIFQLSENQTEIVIPFGNFYRTFCISVRKQSMMRSTSPPKPSTRRKRWVLVGLVRVEVTLFISNVLVFVLVLVLVLMLVFVLVLMLVFMLVGLVGVGVTLSKVMEDKLDMKQFRLFLRTLRMTYNFYEVQSKQFTWYFCTFVEFWSNQVKTVPWVWRSFNLDPSHPDFQLHRLGWDSYNQQRKLSGGGHQVRRIKMRKFVSKMIFLGKFWRSGWGPRRTGRRSLTASTWPTRRERTLFFLWWVIFFFVANDLTKLPPYSRCLLSKQSF